MTQPKPLKHFYIPDDQSIYLLSHRDAQKFRDWVNLCISQLNLLGYRQVELIGKGAFGFVFAGLSNEDEPFVFKFSRTNLPLQVQQRLEEEAYMLSLVQHPSVPQYIEYQEVGKQSILVMERARGKDLDEFSLIHGPMGARLVVKIAVQLGEILLALREQRVNDQFRPLVHGDIKPSNLMWDEESERVALIDWGSAVFAQCDADGQPIASNVMELMSADMQTTNARLGDIYFIGDEQLNGALSSPRFDEQGMASTLYAIASAQSCRFGRKVITPHALGLPKMLASILTYMLSDDPLERRQGGDYFFRNLHVLRQMVFADDDDARINSAPKTLIPTWINHRIGQEIESVVYSSRKSFLREFNDDSSAELSFMNDAQFERYYKNYLQGMGETEKAFIAAISRLGRYPLVGGLAIRWQTEGVYVDSSLNLCDPTLKVAFDHAVNNVIWLARAIHRSGVFKCCFFNAKDTLHIERESLDDAFQPLSDMLIPFDIANTSIAYDETREHSYFEDGEDPDELLQLPPAILSLITQLNRIHHTGCIIFEALPLHLKIHNYFVLLDHTKAEDFANILQQIVSHIPLIEGEGISGFMKLPFKDTRYFDHCAQLPDKYYPRNPKACTS